MRQDIPPGSEVKERRIVRVVISKGAKVYSMQTSLTPALRRLNQSF